MLALERSKLAASLPNAALVASPPVDRAAAFRHAARAGLKELIRRHPERIGDFVEVFDLNLGDRVVEKFVNPRLRMPDPLRETRLVDVAQRHQRADVFLQ